MLKALHVKNFALIDDIEITFHSGLLALTGETGAGKSIILESLHMLFGKRSDQTMIRHHEQKASIKGSFLLKEQVQRRFGLPQEVTIEREIDRNGRHAIRINDEPVTQASLKELTTMIGLIHAQNDTMALSDSSLYLEFIDQMDIDAVSQKHHEYLMARAAYLDQKAKLDAFQKKKEQAIERQSFLEFQLAELKNHHLKPDEKIHLDEQIEKMRHHDKIMGALQQSYQELFSENKAIDSIYHAGKLLEKIGGIDPEYQKNADRFLSAFYELDDLRTWLSTSIETLDFDPSLFDHMQERQFLLDKLEKKYQKSINDLIIMIQELEEELLMITDYDQFILNQKELLDQRYHRALDQGHKLSKERQKNAKKLSQLIIDELKELDLEKATFEIVFEPILETPHLLESGLDHVEFMISLNEGEPIKPLAKVASVGERARFMFAIRSVYATQQGLSLLILDEIDIGVSGKTAAKVALKMVQLSKKMQVIVITHLPQVAAKADFHYGIIKIKEKDRMVTRIFELDHNKRIEMIAMMLSDEKLTHFAIEQAKMLLGK